MSSEVIPFQPEMERFLADVLAQEHQLVALEEVRERSGGQVAHAARGVLSVHSHHVQPRRRQDGAGQAFEDLADLGFHVLLGQHEGGGGAGGQGDAIDLTKKFERVDCGAAADVLAALEANPNAGKGEYVVAVEIPPRVREEKPAKPADAAALILEKMLAGAALDEAAECALETFPRNEVYRARLRVRGLLERE